VPSVIDVLDYGLKTQLWRRLEMTVRPFENCATDYGGPYFTKQGRGKVRAKRYLRLFVCLQTHCCHLEMASSLDVSGFMKFMRL
jgi:hypothetical protein